MLSHCECSSGATQWVLRNVRAIPFSHHVTLCPDLFCLHRNGATQWVLRNASAVKLPGLQYSYEDVAILPQKTDIPAGLSVVHVIDLP